MQKTRARLSLISTVDRAAHTAPATDYRAGQRIAERYVLKERIGEGGMGCVWRAHHEALGCDVALKLTRCPSGPVANRLVREAQLSARISHPGVVRVFDAGVAPHGEPFVVMELLHGVDMRTWFELHGTMPATLAVSTLLPVLQALAHVHDVGIVHRDLKPENVFFANRADGGFEPKLVDFGIAWAPELNTLTTPGDALGTPAYMSPEQAAGREVTIISDVWAFCVVLYETIEGCLPFDATNILAQLATIANDPPRAPKLEHEHPELWAILCRGFQKDASLRWPDTRSLGRVLASWLEGAGVHDDINGHALRPTWLPVSSSNGRELSTGTAPSSGVQPVVSPASGGRSAALETLPSASPMPALPPARSTSPLSSMRGPGLRMFVPMLGLALAGLSSVPFLSRTSPEERGPTVLGLTWFSATAERAAIAASPSRASAASQTPPGIEVFDEDPSVQSSERSPTSPKPAGLSGSANLIEKVASSKPMPASVGGSPTATAASARARMRPLKDPFE